MNARADLDVELCVMRPADAAALLDLHVRNREYWRASGARREDAWFTLQTQRRRLEDEASDRAEDRGLAFGILVDGRLAGRLSLSNIVRGPFCNAYLGYAVDEAHAGRGVGTAALSAAVQVAWEHGLHRVQAATSPDNLASQRVLAKAGFRREGLAKRYLRLDGRWTDQQLWAITIEDPRPPRPR
jgi:ribosomal-protein-alanine N-acetyltransferase